MTLSAQAKQIVSDFAAEDPKMGDIKKRAKALKTNHELAAIVLVLPSPSALDGEGAAKQFRCVDGG